MSPDRERDVLAFVAETSGTITPTQLRERGWTRVDPRPWGKLHARWEGPDGWRLEHCGHPTALRPWSLIAPDGRSIRTGAALADPPAANLGTAWENLAMPTQYVADVRAGKRILPGPEMDREGDPTPKAAARRAAKPKAPKAPKLEDGPRGALPMPKPPEDAAWVTGGNVDRSGAAKYVHIARAKGDPSRTDIRTLPEHLRDRGAEWRRKLKTTPVAMLKWGIWELLADGEPRTFNRIGVELLDKTADVLLDETPDVALWALVQEGKVEHTLEAPIFFRQVAGAEPPARPKGAAQGEQVGPKPAPKRERAAKPPTKLAKLRAHFEADKLVKERNGIRVGDSVRRGRGKEIGRVVEFIEPKPGWYRARIRWSHTEQYVDVSELVPVKGAPREQAATKGEPAPGALREEGVHLPTVLGRMAWPDVGTPVAWTEETAARRGRASGLDKEQFHGRVTGVKVDPTDPRNIDVYATPDEGSERRVGIAGIVVPAGDVERFRARAERVYQRHLDQSQELLRQGRPNGEAQKAMHLLEIDLASAQEPPPGIPKLWTPFGEPDRVMCSWCGSSKQKKGEPKIKVIEEGNCPRCAVSPQGPGATGPRNERPAPPAPRPKPQQGRQRTLLSLFDYSGEWSRPFAEAGWNVLQVDLKHGDDIGQFTAKWLLENVLQGIDIVDGILAAPPCTDFARAGARHWKAKDASGETACAVELVRQTLRTIDFLKPAFWAIENPAGRIAALVPGVGPRQMVWDPCDFAGWTAPSDQDIWRLHALRQKDPARHKFTAEEVALVKRMNVYTKRTVLYGSFNPPEKRRIEPVNTSKWGSWLQSLGGKGARTKELRSVTPAGFARAFYEANKDREYVEDDVPAAAAAKPPVERRAPATPAQSGTSGGAWSSAKRPVTCAGCGETWPRDPALEVACPTCRAKVGAWCKSPSGHKAMRLHAARLQEAFDEGKEHTCPAATGAAAPAKRTAESKAPAAKAGKPRPPSPAPFKTTPPTLDQSADRWARDTRTRLARKTAPEREHFYTVHAAEALRTAVQAAAANKVPEAERETAARAALASRPELVPFLEHLPPVGSTAPGAPVVLIACSGTKLDTHGGLVPAWHLYTSALFRKSLAYARAITSEDNIRILSARHGVIRTDELIGTYDAEMSKLRERERSEWGERAHTTLLGEFGKRPRRAVILAGKDYMNLGGLTNDHRTDFMPWTIETPLLGMEIGERLHWLNDQLRALGAKETEVQKVAAPRPARIRMKTKGRPWVDVQALAWDGDLFVHEDDEDPNILRVTHAPTGRMWDAGFQDLVSAQAVAARLNDPAVRPTFDALIRAVVKKDSEAFHTMRGRLAALLARQGAQPPRVDEAPPPSQLVVGVPDGPVAAPGRRPATGFATFRPRVQAPALTGFARFRPRVEAVPVRA